MHKEPPKYESHTYFPSLYELNTNKTSDITDVGDFEYWKIRPVLLRLESPAQLHEIETNSPQICGEDAELWRAFVARDFPNWEKKNYVPKNPYKWYRVYLKYKKEQQIEIAKDEEILRASMGQLKKAKETNVSKVVDLRSLPKIPKDPWMMANNGGVPLGKRTGLFKKEAPSSLVWSGGSKTKMTNGHSVLTRARREAKEISQRGKLAKPTHELRAQTGQVRKAPAGMVNEYKKASEPSFRIFARKKSVTASPSSINSPSLEEREKRLSAIQAGINQKKSSTTVDETLVGSSDEDELDAEATFRSMSRHATRPAQSSASAQLSSSSQYRPSPSKASPASSSSTTSRPTSKQPDQAQSRQTLSPSSRTIRLPSQMSPTSSGSKPLPKPALSPPAPASAALRGTSPGAAQGEKRPPPGIMRKRPVVDIFNRGSAKKPRPR